MDYTTLKELKERGSIADKYNTATNLMQQIKLLLLKYEQTIESSLEEAETNHVVSESNMHASLEGLRNVKNTLDIWNNNKW